MTTVIENPAAEAAATADRTLTRKDLWKVFLNQLSIRAANNYERQQNAGYTQAMMPVIEKVYDNDEDKLAAYQRHMELFLTNDITSSIPIGISAAMEEEYARKRDFDPGAINAVKTALMGPLAGLGDSLLNGTARPILAGLACSMAAAGLGWTGPILFVIGMSIVSLGIRFAGVFQGYRQGTGLVTKMQTSGLIHKVSELASIAAYIIVGGFIPLIVVINTPLAYSAGETTLKIQEVLDGLMPGMLGLGYTGLMLLLMRKKKISAVWLMFATLVVGLALGMLGILG